MTSKLNDRIRLIANQPQVPYFKVGKKRKSASETSSPSDAKQRKTVEVEIPTGLSLIPQQTVLDMKLNLYHNPPLKFPQLIRPILNPEQNLG